MPHKTRTVNLKTVESHLKMIAAKANGSPFCIAGFGQNPDTGKSLRPKVRHFTSVRDAAGFIQSLSEERHRNVYVGCYSVRHPKDGRKGSESDVNKVYSLCCDFDDDNASQWATRMPVKPSLVLETSPGRFQAFLIFSDPLEPDKAKKLARQLQAFTGCDFGTQDISHVWRITGALNWPNKKKLDAGRSPEPWQVREVSSDGGFVDPDALKAVLPDISDGDARKRKPEASFQQESAQSRSVDLKKMRLSRRIRELILSPLPEGNRSEAVMSVINALVGNSLSDEQIFEVFRTYPIGSKAREKKSLEDWLRPQIEKSRSFVKNGEPAGKDADKWDYARKRFPKTDFPYEVLPEKLSKSFKQLARACATSPTPLPGVAIACLASVIGGTVKSSPKKGWASPLIFFVGDIRESGEGKTHSTRELYNPIARKQKKIEQEHQRLVEEERLKPKKEQEPIPRARGVLATDFTLEGLRADAAVSPHGGILCVQDELSSFVNSQNQYKKGGNDRESWLKIYDGHSARTSRATDPVFVSGAYISLLGGIQPGVWKKIFGGDDLFLVDGTIFRFLVTSEQPRFFEITDESWSDENRKAWESCLEAAADWAEYRCKQEDWKPLKILFDGEAKAIFYNWCNDLKASKFDLPGPVKGYVSKWIEYTVRLAGILYLQRHFASGTCPANIMGVEDVKNAIRVVEFYAGHCTEAIAALQGAEDRKAKTIDHRAIRLAAVLEELAPIAEAENNLLGIGFLADAYNQSPPDGERLSARAMGAYLRELGFETPARRFAFQGVRGRRCVRFDEKILIFIRDVHNVHTFTNIDTSMAGGREHMEDDVHNVHAYAETVETPVNVVNIAKPTFTPVNPHEQRARERRERCERWSEGKNKKMPPESPNDDPDEIVTVTI